MQLVVGRIGKPHGVRGEVTVEVRTDDPGRRFAAGATLHTDPDRGVLTIEQVREHHGRLLVAFAGVGDREGAEALRNTMLVVDSESSEPTDDDDEFWDHEMVGLVAYDASGMQIGELREVLHTPGGDLLVIERPDRPELLVPFVRAFVPEVDVAGRRVVLTPPDGLVDLDRPTE